MPEKTYKHQPIELKCSGRWRQDATLCAPGYQASP